MSAFLRGSMVRGFASGCDNSLSPVVHTRNKWSRIGSRTRHKGLFAVVGTVTAVGSFGTMVVIVALGVKSFALVVGPVTVDGIGHRDRRLWYFRDEARVLGLLRQFRLAAFTATLHSKIGIMLLG
jgi:hypothetical protein